MKPINFDYINAKFTVSRKNGYDLSTALRLWRTRFESYKHFHRDIVTHPVMEPMGKYVEEIWDSIEPVTVQEALSQANAEDRRVYFDALGPSRIFPQMDPKLLDKQVINKKRSRWDGKNKEYTSEYEDIYELYEIAGEKIFKRENTWQQFNNVYAVRCWCTTTEREYWLYVPEETAVGTTAGRGTAVKPDAIRAIAWTVRIDITNPKRILRQGDIIVAEESPESKDTTAYHLTKEQYLDLMYSET